MWALGVGALACTASPEDTGVVVVVDHWTHTAAVCQPPEPFWTTYETMAEFDPACWDQIVADLGIDEDSFEDDPDVLQGVVEAAYNLLARPMGEPLVADDYVRAPFIERMESLDDQLGTTDSRLRNYSWVASHIHEVVLGDVEYGAVYRPRSGALILSEVVWTEQGPTGAALLLHETTHADAGREAAHVSCPDPLYEGLLACDEDWTGAYGVSLGALQTYLISADEQDPDFFGWKSKTEDEIALFSERILSD